MERGAIILNMGGKHGVHAAVAVASLREHYDGPICLICEVDGPGRFTSELIASDPRLAPISVLPDERMKPGGGGQSYFCKTILPQLSPFDTTLFIDADTLVVGNIDEVWPNVPSQVVITQFADWKSTGGRFPPRGKMPQRIEPWRAYEPARVERMFEKHWPAINTGVMAWGPDTKAFADDWYNTCKKRVAFIADETACQIIFPDHNCRVLDDRFNCSVVYQPVNHEVLTRQDVRIWHGHGLKFWKNDGKGQQRPGQKIYLPHYERFLQSNMGNLCRLRPMDKIFSQLSTEDQSRIKQYWI